MTRITYIDNRTGWVLETARIFSNPRFVPVPRDVLADAGIGRRITPRKAA